MAHSPGGVDCRSHRAAVVVPGHQGGIGGETPPRIFGIFREVGRGVGAPAVGTVGPAKTGPGLDPSNRAPAPRPRPGSPPLTGPGREDRDLVGSRVRGTGALRGPGL